MEISEDFVFNFQNDIGINTSRLVLKKYHDNFEKAFNLDGKYPIFLDTNILLNYYGMSKENKKRLKKFFEDKVEKIYLTQQIEKEFQRNRESAISDYFETLNEIKKNYENDLQKGVKSKFRNLLQSKIVEQDFPEIMTAIKTIYQELDVKLFSNDSLMDKVSNDVEKSLDESKNLLFIDPILNIYSKFKRVPNLTNEELEFISKKYDEYLAVYKDAKESVKDRLSFPGCGETKNTVKDGDFIILHEIMKFMKENKTDAILLTRDVTKSDWLKRTRQPFVHYILKSYQLTGQILYIFDATDLLQIISFDNIYKKDTSDYEDLKHDNIQEFYKRRFLNIVISVKEQFKNKIEGLNSLTINEERNSLGENLDLIGYKVSGSSVGILVYQSGSTKKGFQKNVQKRINTCNRLIGRKIIDETILVIIIAKRQFLNRLDYDLLESKHPIKIVVFFCENLNEPDLELLDEIEI